MIEMDAFNAKDPRLLDFVYLFYRRAKFIVVVSLSFLAMGYVLYLLLPKRFAADATFVSFSKTQARGIGEKSSDLSALSSALASMGGGGGQGSNGFYLALIESRRLQDFIVKKLDLTNYYQTDLEGARGLLHERTIVEETKGGLVKLRFTDKDRVVAQKVVALYVEGLNGFLQSVSLTEGQKYEAFLKERIALAQKELFNTAQERESRVKEGLYFSLLKEYEIARANAAKERLDAQIVDESEAGLGPSWPNKRLILLVSFGLGLMLSVFWVFVQQWWLVILSDPRNAYLAKKMRSRSLTIATGGSDEHHDQSSKQSKV